MQVWENEVPVGKIVVGIFCTVLLLYVFGFVTTGGDLAIYSFWAPKQANAQNKVFHNTQAFVDGKNTYITRLCTEVDHTTGNEQQSLNSEIVEEASTIAPEQLNPGTAACVNRAKGD